MRGLILIDRTAFLAAIFIFLFGLIGFKLYQLQVIDHRSYAQASLEQSTAQSSLMAQRGRIYVSSRSGELYPLALTEWRYQLLISPRQVKDKKALSKALSAIVTDLRQEEIYQKISNDKVYIPPLKKDLSRDKAEEIRSRNFGGVFLEPSTLRIYPEADKIAAQIVGFIGADGVGKSGVEGFRNEELTGKSGKEIAQKDSLGRLIAFLSKEQSSDGRDIVLTIDYDVQYYVENKLKEALERFQAESGSVVIMEPFSGEIIAMASQPTFDPNKYYLLKGEEQTRYNSAVISNTYECGSVMKPIVMAMALEEKLIQKETIQSFGRSVTISGQEITNVENRAFGRQTPQQILENSDNVAMAWIGSSLGKERQKSYLDKFGLGSKTNIDLIGEQVRQLPELKNWNALLEATVAFGQGIAVTPLQLAVAYGALANEGEIVWPHVTKYIIDKSGEKREVSLPPKKRAISDLTSKISTEMLEGVVLRGHGKKAAVEGIRVAGKTGTAQVSKPQGGYYDDRFIGSFAGYFPAERPRFVMVVRLDNPKTVRYAESSAAPIFGEIAKWLVDHYQLR